MTGFRKYIESEYSGPAEDVLRHVAPCVLADTVRAEDEDIAVARSKFCGAPDLPADFAWPMTEDGPCWFLAQLNLADLADFDVPSELPSAGLLSFFYHDAGGPAGDHCSVHLFRDANTLRRTEVVRDTRWGEDFHERHLYPRRFSLRQGHSLDEEAFEDMPDAREFACLFNDSFADATHQFFGYPQVHGELLGTHKLIASFGECHDRIMYSVTEAALVALDFTDVEVDYLCT